MKHDPLIPVEPLSDRRWQEIRSRVLEQAAELPRAHDLEMSSADASSPSGLRPRVTATIGALAVAAAAALWMAHAEMPHAAETSRVVTDVASATASAGDVTLELAAHTSVLVVELGPDQWLVSIEHGRVRFLVPPRGARPSFSVEAGRTRVLVIGTTFSVSREPGAPSGVVEVERGTVRVEDLAQEHVLRDGEQWPPRTAHVPVAADARVASSSPMHVSPIAEADDRADARSVTEAAARRTGVADHVADPAPASPSAPSVPAISDSSATRPDEAAPAGLASARDRYLEAEAAESVDPARALGLYATLVDEGGVWSAPALMAEARLEYELHHEPRARALSERYLSEHPAGINAEDARELLRRLP